MNLTFFPFYNYFSFFLYFFSFLFIYPSGTVCVSSHLLFHHSVSSHPFFFALSLVSQHLHHNSNPLFASRLFLLLPISNHYTYIYPRNSVVNIHFICIASINFILIFIIVIFFFTSQFKMSQFPQSTQRKGFQSERDRENRKKGVTENYYDWGSFN